MTFLSFSPEEYHALSNICQPLNLHCHRPHTLKKVLVKSLAGTLPELAQRIGRFRGQEQRILHEHLRQLRQHPWRHSLTSEEFRLLAEAHGAFSFHARFIRSLRGVLIEHFQRTAPDLATKLEQLSHRQFEMLCEEVQERTRTGA